MWHVKRGNHRHRPIKYVRADARMFSKDFDVNNRGVGKKGTQQSVWQKEVRE